MTSHLGISPARPARTSAVRLDRELRNFPATGQVIRAAAPSGKRGPRDCPTSGQAIRAAGAGTAGGCEGGTP